MPGVEFLRPQSNHRDNATHFFIRHDIFDYANTTPYFAWAGGAFERSNTFKEAGSARS